MLTSINNFENEMFFNGSLVDNSKGSSFDMSPLLELKLILDIKFSNNIFFSTMS